MKTFRRTLLEHDDLNDLPTPRPLPHFKANNQTPILDVPWSQNTAQTFQSLRLYLQ